ncbi:hypothetical protein EVAR_69559_1 [Eumeta japonica]|uniref:Uncharacterized protein n=1 Tax=Eumeta variegata TaxID=151549 RepID=A0A4C2A4P4_EUMVA|nr:hypothetical protein EVAR_69559_1 [Eumeta japonica]
MKSAGGGCTTCLQKHEAARRCPRAGRSEHLLPVLLTSSPLHRHSAITSPPAFAPLRHHERLDAARPPTKTSGPSGNDVGHIHESELGIPGDYAGVICMSRPTWASSS